MPALTDGVTVTGPAKFRHDGLLLVRGKVALRNLDLDLRGSIRVASGSQLELDNVRLLVSDPPGAQNGVSGLNPDGAFTLIVRHSTMEPVGTAHPMWHLKGTVEVEDFQTRNSEFHLDHATAKLEQLKIFELEISNGSSVAGKHLELVFLSTHSGENDKLEFSDVPADIAFSKKLTMGSQATADLQDAKIQLFLIYVHGRSHVSLSRMGRVQLAFFPACRGALRLPQGRIGSEHNPVVVPGPSASDCPFRFTLKDVNVDTWDVYARADADLKFTNSRIDEMNASERAKITVRNSELYADWLAADDDAQLTIENSKVGSLRLASERPDLATSEIHLGGRSYSRFTKVRFDCGIVIRGEAQLDLNQTVEPPKFIRRLDNAVVRNADPQLRNDNE